MQHLTHWFFEPDYPSLITQLPLLLYQYGMWCTRLVRKQITLVCIFFLFRSPTKKRLDPCPATHTTYLHTNFVRHVTQNKKREKVKYNNTQNLILTEEKDITMGLYMPITYHRLHVRLEKDLTRMLLTKLILLRSILLICVPVSRLHSP